MCGIVGILNLDTKKVSREQLTRMCDVMQHRGPDDEGYYIDGNIGLGHKRLSIIDLKTGKQPIHNEDKTIWIVYNGEIYNYLELKDDLKKKKKHQFHTSSDTEVIIHLYEEHGEKCVEHLNGVFAFAIWDGNNKKLFLARDRLGIKPLYYFYNETQLIFASEIKAILQKEDIIAEPDYTAILDYMTFMYVLGEKTFFKGIKKLMPGHTATLGNNNLQIKEYWDLKFDIDYEHDESYFIEELHKLLKDSIRIQLRSDVPLGCHLSGGIDSSSVTCLTASMLDHPVKTFSGAFKEGNKYNETDYAKIVANRINADYFEIFPNGSDFLKILPKIIWHLDEPVVGPGVFPQYFVSKLASENVKVVLGGQGGDEVFAGYSRYLQFYLEQKISEHSFKEVIGLIRSVGLKGIGAFLLRGLSLSPDERYFSIVSVLSQKELKKLFTKEFYQTIRNYNCFEMFKNFFNNSNASNYLDMALYYDIKTYLTGLLQVEDRTSMSVSLESRVPLLDHRIVEFSATIPHEIKIKNFKLKHVLKSAMKSELPGEIYNRTDKKGFPTPVDIWFKKYSKEIQNILLNDRGIFNKEYVKSLLNSDKNHSMIIWMMLCVELWFKEFID